MSSKHRSCDHVLTPLATTTIQTHPLTWSAVVPHTNFRFWTTQAFCTIVVHMYVKYVYIHAYWTCASMVAVVTLTAWVLPPPNQICYDDQNDNSRTNKSTNHSSCNTPCITTYRTRGICCCCWSCYLSCYLSWWLSWWLRWLRGWCWRRSSCREWRTS